MVTFGQEMQSAEITGDTDMSQSGSRSDDEIEIAAVIFDMDGVLTDTAHAHFSAWKETFDTFLKDCGVDEPFTRNDYLKNVDGVPRYDGVRGFLASRDIQLPEGDPDDESMETIFGLGNHKNTRFRNWLSENQVPVFDDAADLLEGLKHAGIKVGVFSASRNARRVLESAGLSHMFDATMDGEDARETGLSPKPDPDQLVETAARLGCDTSETAVIEDAILGVQAGAAGRFRLVIGVDRQDDGGRHRHALRADGADLVTRDLRKLLLPGGGGLKTLDRLPLVWERLDEVNERLGVRPLSVFLDYDGTLSPIVDDYRKATIAEETRAAVARLAERYPVAVISGRDLADVRERVGLEHIIYAGSHGFDIAGPGGLEEQPDEAEGFLDPLNDAAEELRDSLSGMRGADVERKTFSIAVHYRRVAERDVEKIEDIIDEIVGRHDKLSKRRGKKVFEIHPRADWDKGSAVEWLLANTRLGGKESLALYLGDDLTDEDVFGVLSDTGLCFAVRGDRRATLADYALEDTDDIRRFVDWLGERKAEER